MHNKNNLLFFALMVALCSFFYTKSCNDDTRFHAYRVAYKQLGPRELIKRAIFNEGHAENPTAWAWKTGLSINDIVAYQHVNKEWNTICKEFVDAARKPIIKKYKDHFTIIPSTLIFNKYGDWCCVTKNIALLMGNIGKDVPQNIQLLKPTKNFHIRSLDTRYYGPNSTQFFDDMFLIINPPIVVDSSYLLLPSQQRLYGFCVGPNTGYANICNFQKIFSPLMQKIFNLSSDNKFWYPYFKAPGIPLIKNSFKSMEILINVHNSPFSPYIDNFNLLNNAHNCLASQPCACSTGFIDKNCYALFQQGCNIAEEESLAGEYTKLSELFIRYHTLHEIKNCGDATSDTDIDFHANPAGDIIAQTSRAKLLLHDNQTPLKENYSTTQLLEFAATHASNWQRNGLVLYGVTYNQENILLPQHFCKADGTLIHLLNRSFSKSPEETVIDICHVYCKKEGSEKLRLFHIFSLHNNTDKTSRIVSFDANNLSHPIPYACERLKTLKNGFNFLSSKYNKEVPWNCSITVPPNVSVSFMQYIKRFTSNIYESSEAVSFFSHHTPFKEWELLGNVPFEVQDNKITFPSCFHTHNGGRVNPKYHITQLSPDERIEDTDYIVIDGGIDGSSACTKYPLLCVVIQNTRTAQWHLQLDDPRPQYAGEKSADTYHCTTFTELQDGFNALLHDIRNNYTDCRIKGPKEIVKNFITHIHELNHTFATIKFAGLTKENPIAASNSHKITPLTCEILKNQNCFVKPIGLFERVTFGFKARFGSHPYTNLTSSYVTIGGGGTLCVASFLFAAFLKEFRKSFPSLAQTSYLTPATYLLLGLIPILQVCASEDHQKFVWPSRFIGWALYACAGKFLYTSLLPQVGLTLLPPLALAAHIFEVNKKNPLLKMTFGEFYDSLPARLHRIYKKAQSYLPMKNNAQ